MREDGFGMIGGNGGEGGGRKRAGQEDRGKGLWRRLEGRGVRG